jgi:hypothetical protein
LMASRKHAIWIVSSLEFWFMNISSLIQNHFKKGSRGDDGLRELRVLWIERPRCFSDLRV